MKKINLVQNCTYAMWLNMIFMIVTMCLYVIYERQWVSACACVYFWYVNVWIEEFYFDITFYFYFFLEEFKCENIVPKNSNGIQNLHHSKYILNQNYILLFIWTTLHSVSFTWTNHVYHFCHCLSLFNHQFIYCVLSILNRSHFYWL